MIKLFGQRGEHRANTRPRRLTRFECELCPGGIYGPDDQVIAFAELHAVEHGADPIRDLEVYQSQSSPAEEAAIARARQEVR